MQEETLYSAHGENVVFLSDSNHCNQEEKTIDRAELIYHWPCQCPQECQHFDFCSISPNKTRLDMRGSFFCQRTRVRNRNALENQMNRWYKLHSLEKFYA